MASSNPYYLEHFHSQTETIKAGVTELPPCRLVNRAGTFPFANGDYTAGATTETIKANATGTIATDGTATVEVGAAITAIDTPLIADTAGKVRPASDLVIGAGATAVTSSAANGDVLGGGVLPQYVVGRALDTATGTGVEYIRVKLGR